MTWRIAEGDCRGLLARMQQNSVHCIITSPPYYGLRDYKLPSLIWGGSPECEHQWRPESFKMEKGNTISANVSSHKKEALRSSQGQFCQLCPAWIGSLGLEPSLELYLDHLMECMAGVKRILREDGVAWLNMGDSFWGGKGHSGQGSPEYQASRATQSPNKPYDHIGGPGLVRPTDRKHPVLKPLDLAGIPWRFAFRMQEAGWYLRSAIVWHKPAPMPESVAGWRWEKHRIKIKSQDYGEYHQPGKISSGEVGAGHRNRDAVGGVWQGGAQWADCPDCAKCSPNDDLVLRKGAWRPTSSYEHILMFTKSDSYFCDQEAVRERASLTNHGDGQYGPQRKYFEASEWTGGNRGLFEGSQPMARNPRDVLRFSTEPFAGAHFATFPTALAEWCIKAGTSEKGCCPECGSPWARIIDHVPGSIRGGLYADELCHVPSLRVRENGKSSSLGWKETCPHKGLTPVSCLVLDPFVGAGSAGIAAVRLGRRFIGLELSPQYVRLSKERIVNEAAIGNTSEIAQESGQAQLGMRI